MGAQSKKPTLAAVIGGILKDVLFFPFWWYSLGLVKFISYLRGFLSYRQKSLGLGVWIKNIFVPMYGQRDWQGVLISIFIRIMQIVFRSIAMTIWLVVAIAMLILWLTFPAAAVFGIVLQFI